MAELDEVQLKALVPRALKLKAFAALSLRDLKFKTWLEHELAALVASSPGLAAQQQDAKASASDVAVVER
jgi:hypothetical protein